MTFRVRRTPVVEREPTGVFGRAAAQTPSPWVAHASRRLITIDPFKESEIKSRIVPSLCGKAAAFSMAATCLRPRTHQIHPRTEWRLPRRSIVILDRVGRIGLGRSPSAITVAPIIGLGVPHAVDHGSQNGDSRIVQLTPGALDLRKPAHIVLRGEHRAVGPSTQNQRIGHGKDRGRVDDDQVVALPQASD